MTGRGVGFGKSDLAEQHQTQKQNQVVKLLDVSAEKAHHQHGRQPRHRPVLTRSEPFKEKDRPRNPGDQADLIQMPLAGLPHQIRSRQISAAPDNAGDPAPSQSAGEEVNSQTAPPQMAHEHPTRQPARSRQQKRPVGGIEQPALRIAQPRGSFQQVRIPKRDLPLILQNLPRQRPKGEKLGGQVIPSSKLRTDQ